MAEPPIPEGLREEIARTLQPVRPLASPGRRAVRLLPIAALVASVPFAIGLRDDASTIGALRLWVASALQAAVAFWLLIGALNESIPGRLPALRRLFVLAGLGSLFMLALTGVTFRTSPTHVPPREETLYFLGCLVQPFLLGLLLLGGLGQLLRRGIVTRPVVTGSVAGLGSGLVTDSAWRLCCQVSDPTHVLATHAVAILALSLTGALVGAVSGARRRRGLPGHRGRAG